MRIRTRYEYQRISRSSKRTVGKFIIIDSCQNSFNRTRCGITVTKKYGKAHARNRFKRLIKEAFRQLYPQFKTSLDCNIRPRTLAHKATFQHICAELLYFLADKA